MLPPSIVVVIVGVAIRLAVTMTDCPSKFELWINELNAVRGLNMVTVGVGVDVPSELVPSLKDFDKIREVGIRTIELARVTNDALESKKLVL
jgi:hypothetical protein